MKIAILSLLALTTFTMATPQPQKSIIVSYPDETPDSVLQEAKDAIISAGGSITHEYKLIKGFAALSPANILDTLKTMGIDYNPVIEEDQMVSTNE